MSDGPRYVKRMRRWERAGDVRFVTFSCEGRLPLLGHPRIRDEFAEALGRARVRYGFALFAWVAMPEHVHLLVRGREGESVGRALWGMKKGVAQRVIARWREMDAEILRRIARPDGSPRFWQAGGGFDRNVRGVEEFTRQVRYIHLNPVSRGLVERPEAWRWSSVCWWTGRREGEVARDPPPGDEAGVGDVAGVHVRRGREH